MDWSEGFVRRERGEIAWTLLYTLLGFGRRFEKGSKGDGETFY